MMNSYAAYAASMIIFGTLGIFARYVALPSSVIALFRGFLGSLCLLPVMIAPAKRPVIAHEIRANWKILLLSSLLLDGNWICLFESYRYTTLAIASVLYYVAPLFVLLFSVAVFHEKLRTYSIISVAATFTGMILMSSLNSLKDANTAGILFGICAAMCYAGMMITNKMIKNMGSIETTAVQLFTAAVLMVPYALLRGDLQSSVFTARSLAVLAVLGTVHTGLGFLLFFYGIKKLRSQEIAILGYIDPVIPVIVSFAVYHEWLSPLQMTGMVLVCAALVFGSIMMNRKPLVKGLKLNEQLISKQNRRKSRNFNAHKRYRPEQSALV